MQKQNYEMEKSVIILSGGMDSATLLHDKKTKLH